MFFTKSFRFEKRRAFHADQTRDLCKLNGCHGCADGPGAGQEIRGAEGQRTIGFIVIGLQRATADGRWNVDTASVPRGRFAKRAPAQICDPEHGRANALRTASLPTKRWPDRAAAFEPVRRCPLGRLPTGPHRLSPTRVSRASCCGNLRALDARARLDVATKKAKGGFR